MQGQQVVYQGRSIATDGFRAFIYGPNGAKKLVNSWEEFEVHIALGIWFSSIEEVIEPSIEEEKSESSKKRSK